MSQVPQTFDPTVPRWDARVALTLPLVAGLLALLGTQQPMWALLALVAGAVGIAISKWPEASTLTVIFVLYSNLAGVAVEFHGVPFIFGASFLMLLLIPMFYHVVLRREQVVIHPALIMLILFVMVQLAGTLSARRPDVAAKELLTSLTEGVLLFFFVINVVRTQQTLRRAVWALIAAGTLMSLAPLYQQATGEFGNNFWGFGQVSNAAIEIEPNAGMGSIQPRLAGSVGEQNRFAQVMLMLFPLALFRWWSEPTIRLRMLAALATALIVGAVVLTFSRGAAVGIVVILLAMVAMRYISMRHLSLVLVALVALLIAVPQYGARLAKLQGVWELVDSEGASQHVADGSMKSRLTEMGAAGLAFLDHPLVGVGPGMFRYHYREYAEQVGLRVSAKGRRSHSILPGVAAESGALGLFLFVAIVLVTLRDLIRAHANWKETRPAQANMAASFTLVIVAYMTTAMFLHLGYVRYFWLMIALAGAASRVGDDAPNSEAIPAQEQI